MTREQYLEHRVVLRAFGVEGWMFALAGMARAERRWRRQKIRLAYSSDDPAIPIGRDRTRPRPCWAARYNRLPRSRSSGD